MRLLKLGAVIVLICLASGAVMLAGLVALTMPARCAELVSVGVTAAPEQSVPVPTPSSSESVCDSSWVLPLEPGSYVIGDLFGRRFHPIYHRWLLHSGIDLQAAEWTPVYAAHAGTIDFAGSSGDLGNFVRIVHGGGFQTGYGHMVQIASGIERGDSVGAGDLIGYVGTTGGSTGFHLHFMVIVDGKVVNPVVAFEEFGLTF
jgi:murein DD-endopeptidase MepM/ murein hydrolase activator NlpD